MKMSGADLNVIKDIPGYKLILKTVLKSQIQQLVEQLADQTGEESILLTASVTDGSLSHLGSESAKDFIDNHDDIKSQFLGFIIKKHHEQIEIERGQQNISYTDNQNISSAPVQSGPGPRPNLSPAYRNSFNDNSPTVSSVHPVSLSKVSPKGRGRGRGGFRGRAVPYSNPSRKPFKNYTIKRTATSTPKQHSESDSVIRAYQDNVPAIDLSADDDFKIESVEVLEEVGNISDSSQQGNNRKRSRRNSSHGSVVGSNSSSEPVPSSLAIASDDQITDTVNLGISKTEGVETSDENVHQKFENSHADSEFDPSFRVKVEAGEESEMDLGITGVHPGYAAPSEDSWVHHVQSGMDLSAIAGTSQGDMMGTFNQSTKNENKGMLTSSTSSSADSNFEKTTELSSSTLSAFNEQFSDLPTHCKFAAEELMTMKNSSKSIGNFATFLTKRLFPELFTADNLRFGYNYNGFRHQKKPLENLRRSYLQRYLLFFYPHLKDPKVYHSSVVDFVNEVLRRKKMKT